MKSMVSVLFIGLVGLVIVAQATDYCSKALCGSLKHIACNNTGKFAKSCPADRKLPTLTAADKAALVKKHNQLRNILANGKLKNFEPCSRMATMQWDETLAYLAGLNVKTCKFEHDECHNTEKFKHSGQNLAATWSSEELSKSLQKISLPLVDSWWAEHENTTMKDINSYPQAPKAVIGHFTVMAVQANNRMGCAFSTFKDKNMGNMNSLLMACNYAETNMINSKIYGSGKTASKCATGPNPKFEGLCSQKEEY